MDEVALTAGERRAVELTHDPAGDWDPSWSPDGSMVAFNSNRSGTTQIWIIPAAPPISIPRESWGSLKGKYRD